MRLYTFLTSVFFICSDLSILRLCIFLLYNKPSMKSLGVVKAHLSQSCIKCLLNYYFLLLHGGGSMTILLAFVFGRSIEVFGG
jgi:hypothetical protein